MRQQQRRIAYWIAIVGVLLLGTGCGATQVQAQNAAEAIEELTRIDELTVVGHIGGPAMATAAYGDYALVGYSFEFADWRFNLRRSNTEPVVRLNVESRGDPALMRARTEELLALMGGAP